MKTILKFQGVGNMSTEVGKSPGLEVLQHIGFSQS